MKYLIVGLGNIGYEYEGTRHNIGFTVLDAFAKASNTAFQDKRYGFVAEASVRGRKLILLKPSTYMNLSGNAVRYWMQQEKIPLENVLVIVDLMALAEVVAYSKAQAGVVGCSQRACDVLEAVVAAVAALSLETQGSHGQCKVVHDYEYIFQGDFLLLHPVTYCIAAQVHICRWLEQYELASAY